MTSPTNPVPLSAGDFGLTPEEADAYVVSRLRDAAFEAVMALWRKRQAAGVSQKDLARILNRDTGWISKALRGPANWEFKTFARLVRALDGEAEIVVRGLEEPLEVPENYHAYKEYRSSTASSLRVPFLPARPKVTRGKVEALSVSVS